MNAHPFRPHGAWAARVPGRTIPIIPPEAKLSTASRIPPEARGKVPGKLGEEGWHGYGWQAAPPPTAGEIQAWEAAGAGVGLRLGGGILALDIDVTDPAIASAIVGLARDKLAAVMPRVGRAPKATFLLRAALCAEGLRKKTLAFTAPDGTRHAVELLTEGQQTVVAGIHPRTMQPYAWPDGEPESIDTLPTVTEAQLDGFFEDMATVLDMFGAGAVEAASGAAGDRAATDQPALLAPPGAALGEALASIRNTGDRDAWIAMGHRVKAAGGDVGQWEEWSNRWAGPPEDSDALARLWDGFRPPFAAGWPHIEREARAAGWHGSAMLDFADVAPPGVAPAGPGKMFGKLRVLTLTDAAASPPRRYLLRGLIAEGELSQWWGAPKSGKSFLLLRVAYGLALGNRMWNRRARPCRVLYVTAEGMGGFPNRLEALKRKLGDAGDDFRFIAQPVQIGPPSTDLAAVIAAAKDMRADLVVLDTLARTFGTGDENTAQDMGRFIANVDRLREESGAHVAIIHHGKKDGKDARGSGALGGAADLIVKIEKGAVGQVSTATVENAKDDADGDALAFRLEVVAIGVDDEGEAVNTCIAEEAVETRARGARLGKPENEVLGVLCELVTVEGVDWPAAAGPPQTTGRVIDDKRWRAECDRRRVFPSENEGSRRSSLRRAIGRLRDSGAIGLRDGWAWPSEASNPPPATVPEHANN